VELPLGRFSIVETDDRLAVAVRSNNKTARKERVADLFVRDGRNCRIPISGLGARSKTVGLDKPQTSQNLTKTDI
jgi:hypothetical protein